MRFQNPPRGEGVPFRGTHRYASLTAHYEEEQSPRDDLEGWFYALYEITAGELPWKEDCGAPNVGSLARGSSA
jgi:casein kinase 1/casein kinase I family protein HRR25